MSIQIDDLRVKAMARIVHEANRAYCMILGDDSQKPWSEAPGYNHESAMVAVRAICQNPAMSPSDVHDKWMEAKAADGWKYGPTKDYDKKTHPSMVTFDELSAEEKYKDYIVIYNVMSYLDYMGLGKNGQSAPA